MTFWLLNRFWHVTSYRNNHEFSPECVSVHWSGVSSRPIVSSLQLICTKECRSMHWWHWCAQVLTKDSVTVSVDAVVYYRVSNATISVANVENAHHSTRLLAQTTLRNTLGMRPLHEILSDRDTISSSMQLTLDEATDAWGIKVERVEMWVLRF